MDVVRLVPHHASELSVGDMMMKTKMATIFMLCLSLSAWADLDIRGITPAKAKQLGWKIETHAKEEYMTFTVQPPNTLLNQKRSAHLSVRDGRKMISTSLLGLQEFRGSQRYVFSVSRNYLKDSVFELGPDEESITHSTTSFRIHLNDFVP
jgi:hypothetical protein